MLMIPHAFSSNLNPFTWHSWQIRSDKDRQQRKKTFDTMVECRYLKTTYGTAWCKIIYGQNYILQKKTNIRNY